MEKTKRTLIVALYTLQSKLSIYNNMYIMSYLMSNKPHNSGWRHWKRSKEKDVMKKTCLIVLHNSLVLAGGSSLQDVSRMPTIIKDSRCWIQRFGRVI